MIIFCNFCQHIFLGNYDLGVELGAKRRSIPYFSVRIRCKAAKYSLFQCKYRMSLPGTMKGAKKKKKSRTLISRKIPLLRFNLHPSIDTLIDKSLPLYSTANPVPVYPEGFLLTLFPRFALMDLLCVECRARSACKYVQSDLVLQSPLL